MNQSHQILSSLFEVEERLLTDEEEIKTDMVTHEPRRCETYIR